MHQEFGSPKFEEEKFTLFHEKLLCLEWLNMIWILTLKQISTKSFWKFNCSWSWYSMGYICCVFCNAFDEFVRIDFNCKSSLPLCLSGYSEHQIHLHITQFWQIVSFAPKFSTFVIEMDANLQNEREPELLNFGARSSLLLEKDYLCKTQILPFANSGERFGASSLSASDLCGNFVAATEVKPACSLIYRLLPRLASIHTEAACGV